MTRRNRSEAPSSTPEGHPHQSFLHWSVVWGFGFARLPAPAHLAVSHKLAGIALALPLPVEPVGASFDLPGAEGWHWDAREVLRAETARAHRLSTFSVDALIRLNLSQLGAELVTIAGIRHGVLRSLTLWGDDVWAARQVHHVVAAATLVPLARALAKDYRITCGCRPDRAALVEALCASERWLGEMARWVAMDRPRSSRR